MSDKTLFQKILDRELPAKIVHEDELCGAFDDVDPKAPTHVLVVPRTPVSGASALTDDHAALVGHLLVVAAKIARERGLGNGYRLVINDGEDGGQSVPHLHVHLLGGRALKWPPG